MNTGLEISFPQQALRWAGTAASIYSRGEMMPQITIVSNAVENEYQDTT